MTKLAESKVAKAPLPRLKEWTHDRQGLEITFPIVSPSAPMNIAFGPFNYEREPFQMVRFITADLLDDKYGVIAISGDVFQPAENWWLLIPTHHVSDLVHPNSLRRCLENLRTVSTPDLILCFHIIEYYPGKVSFQWWFELIIAILPTFLVFASRMNGHIPFLSLFR